MNLVIFLLISILIILIIFLITHKIIIISFSEIITRRIFINIIVQFLRYLITYIIDIDFIGR